MFCFVCLFVCYICLEGEINSILPLFHCDDNAAKVMQMQSRRRRGTPCAAATAATIHNRFVEYDFSPMLKKGKTCIRPRCVGDRCVDDATPLHNLLVSCRAECPDSAPCWVRASLLCPCFCASSPCPLVGNLATLHQGHKVRHQKTIIMTTLMLEMEQKRGEDRSNNHGNTVIRSAQDSTKSNDVVNVVKW